MDSKELAKKAVTLQDMLTKYRPQIERALPKQLNIERFNRLALTYATRRTEVLKCELKSIVSAFMQSAQLGLEPDDIRGHAHIVPFWDSKKGMMMAVFIPGYKGLIDLAMRSKQVSLIDAHIVYDKEEYTYSAGLAPVLEHKPKPPTERGEPIAAYAIAKMKDGATKHVWLWKDEILDIRAKSAGYKAYVEKKVKSSVWIEYPSIMWIKTAIRYLAKFIPQSPELQKAAGYEEAVDVGEPIKEFFFDEDQAEHFQEEAEAKATEESDALKGKTLKNKEALQGKLGDDNGN